MIVLMPAVGNFLLARAPLKHARATVKPTAALAARALWRTAFLRVDLAVLAAFLQFASARVVRMR